MAGTFSQIYIQVVFAVKGRQNLIHSSWEDELYKYITGIVLNKGQKILAINGVSDHIHLLISIRPSCCLSDLVREIKKSSNEFINERRFTKYRFCWQEGFGAFSYSYSSVERVIKYIGRQKEHHRKTSFRNEYKDFLQRFSVDYKDEYLFEWVSDGQE
jgi:putative transposase